MRSACDPAPVGEEFQADEEGIAGKGRGARIGRVAVAGGAERQNLPDVLPGGGEKGDKLVRGGPKVADAPVGGQRADVEQNSGGTLELHVFIIAGRRQAIADARPGGYNPSVRQRELRPAIWKIPEERVPCKIDSA